MSQDVECVYKMFTNANPGLQQLLSVNQMYTNILLIPDTPHDTQSCHILHHSVASAVYVSIIVKSDKPL